jgi:hypothetical protein
VLWLFVNSDLWCCLAVLLLPILSYERDCIYLEFLVACCVLWGLQQLSYMLLKNEKLNQCQKYGILLWIQVAMFQFQPWNVSQLKISYPNWLLTKRYNLSFAAFLFYAALVITATFILVFHFIPLYGQTHIMVYIGVCSLVGSLSVCLII